MSPPRIPRATYRLQLNREFTFARATEIVPYLRALGVSHVYCSPYLKARAGSAHGYDIVDHGVLNPEIGSKEDYERFVAALAEHDMGQVLDIVPNHMGVAGDDNPWWLDVLENGQASDYANFFDIDWQPVKPELHGKVLLPLLEDHYGAVLERGLLKLEFDAARGEFSVRYYEHRFPIEPKCYARILGQRLEALSADEAQVAAYRGLIAAFEGLPSRHEAGAERRAQRNRDKEAHKQRLAEICQSAPRVSEFISENLREFNGTEGVRSSFERLHALLEEQAYRPAYWRVAADEINYRRFFDVNTLAALRTERPEVFAATHRLILDLVGEGKVQALRIDHPDGLYDPGTYFQALREAVAARGGSHDIYIVAEKILEPAEPLPEGWAIQGTTGYDFAALANGVFVHPEGEEPLTSYYERFIGRSIDFAQLLYERKKLVMRALMSGELMVLANLLDRLSESDPRTRDYTLHALRDTLMDVIACFPVYRTYATAQGLSEQDRRHINHAVREARRRSPAADASVFDFVRHVLLLEALEDKTTVQREATLDFVMKFQQFTAPVMAKGLEDTSFYVYHRLVSLNEVGGDPRRFSVTGEAYHRATRERHERWPHSMLANSTHDTKRSEDVRARLNVLSEVAGGWRGHVLRWSRMNQDKKREVADEPAPDSNDEYLLYQTLVGAWPLAPMNEERLAEFCRRIEAYMLKAVREAKVHTSWLSPDEGYETALTEFVRVLLLEKKRNRFVADLAAFQREIARLGLLNSLAQTLLKLTAPGVPDIYQGTEIWDFSLVDPDNRRPVDYERRRVLLEQVRELAGSGDGVLAARARLLLDAIEDGRAKLYLIYRVLGLRREHPELFEKGDYLPLTVEGERAEYLVAFARRHEGKMLVVVVPRWFSRLTSDRDPWPLGDKVWRDTAVQAPGDARFRNVLTGERVDLKAVRGRPCLLASDLLANYPIAVLLGSDT